MNEREAIIHELVVRGPFVVVGIQSNTICATCNVCTFSLGRERFNDPVNHEPECLWRRALTVDPVCSSRVKP